MRSVALIVLGVFGCWGLGTAVAMLIVGRSSQASPHDRLPFLIARAELIGLGAVLGIGLTSEVLFLWSLQGGRLGQTISLSLAIVGIALGAGALWRLNRTQSANLEAAESIPSDNDIRFACCCACIVMMLFLFAVTQTLLTPQRFWDERAFYGLKAIVLFEDRTIDSADLAEPDFVQGHPRYPLLISLAEEHLYALLGHVEDRWSKILFPMLYVGLVLTTAGVLSRHQSLGAAWMGALLMATIPVLMPDDYGFLCGQADAPVACFNGLAALYIWDAFKSVESNRQPTSWTFSLMMAALLAGLAGFTKDEGISYIMINVAAFIGALIVGMWFRKASLPGSSIARLKAVPIAFGLFVLLLIPFVILEPWFRHRAHLPLTGEMNYFGRLSIQNIWSGLESLRWSIPHLAERMFWEASIWGLQWWFLTVTLVLFPRRALSASQSFLLLNLLGSVAALLLAGILAPVAFQEHIGGSSHRYLMQISPAALLFAWGQMHALRISNAAETP